MIRLAVEVPCNQLQLTLQADLDFVLAHKVLEEPGYAKYFQQRPQGRELILDNSMHELGDSIPVEDLLEASKLVRADYVVAPDRLSDARWSVERYEETLEAFRGRGVQTKVAAVLVGKDEYERGYAMRAYEDASMLCLPYKRPRLDWWEELPPDMPWKRIHLLGMSTVEELKSWKWIEAASGDINFSLDTTKPVRWGILGRRIDDGASLRGGKLDAKNLLEVTELTREMQQDIAYNISFLKKVMQ